MIINELPLPRLQGQGGGGGGAKLSHKFNPVDWEKFLENNIPGEIIRHFKKIIRVREKGMKISVLDRHPKNRQFFYFNLDLNFHSPVFFLASNSESRSLELEKNRLEIQSLLLRIKTPEKWVSRFWKRALTHVRLSLIKKIVFALFVGTAERQTLPSVQRDVRLSFSTILQIGILFIPRSTSFDPARLSPTSRGWITFPVISVNCLIIRETQADVVLWSVLLKHSPGPDLIFR